MPTALTEWKKYIPTTPTEIKHLWQTIPRWTIPCNRKKLTDFNEQFKIKVRNSILVESYDKKNLLKFTEIATLPKSA